MTNEISQYQYLDTLNVNERTAQEFAIDISGPFY